MLNVPDFVVHVAEAVVGGLVLAALLKITLSWWKNIAIGVSAFAIVAAVIAGMFLAISSVGERYIASREKAALQEKIDNYVKGHNPEEYESGYRVKIVEIGRRRSILAFMYPEGTKSASSPHPLDSYFLKNDLERIMNDNGYPGEPMWGRQMFPMGRDEIDSIKGK